jgi:hypothetical protein
MATDARSLNGSPLQVSYFLLFDSIGARRGGGKKTPPRFYKTHKNAVEA